MYAREAYDEAQREMRQSEFAESGLAPSEGHYQYPSYEDRSRPATQPHSSKAHALAQLSGPTIIYPELPPAPAPSSQPSAHNPAPASSLSSYPLWGEQPTSKGVKKEAGSVGGLGLPSWTGGLGQTGSGSSLSANAGDWLQPQIHAEKQES